jgi:ubiquinone biosynthesis protein Coq4
MNPFKMAVALFEYAAGSPLGDVAVLKVDALGGASEELAAKLAPVRGYAPTLDLAALRRLPAGTLGHAYATFLDANGIVPLAVSPPVRERFRDDPYALRYAATHDLHHVLTGFDTTLAGEAGVLAFNVAQGTAPVGRWALLFVRILFTLAAPWRARAIAANVRRGLAMGDAAELVMAAPLESWLDQPIDDVRRRVAVVGEGSSVARGDVESEDVERAVERGAHGRPV